MDAKTCLEIAKGWLENAAEEEDMAAEASYLDLAHKWLDCGEMIVALEMIVGRLVAKDVDGPAEGEDGQGG